MKSLHGGQRINERETKNYGRPSPADSPDRRDCFFGSLFRGTDNPPKLPTIYSASPAIVRKVQVALRNRGYYTGLVDGFLEQNTTIGIMRF